jgi:hypothetical protein
MKIKTLKPVRLESGNVPVGAVIDVPHALAMMLLSRADAARYVEPVPTQAAGTQSSASPVAPVSPQQTSNESKPGARRGRRKKNEA